MLSSERIASRENLPLDEDDLRDLFEHAPCGYLAAGLDGRITRINRTLLEWLDATPEHMVGSRFLDLLTIAGKIYYETHFAPLLRMQGHFDEVALDLRRADGRVVPVLVNARERAAANGRPGFVRITLFNASERRRYERELLDARRQSDAAAAELRELTRTLESRVETEVARRLQAEGALRQAQKMDAIGQLTGGVAHDFNNLLTVVLGGLETVGRQLEHLPGEAALARVQRSLAMARHGAERCATLTARLLAFARRQPLRPKPIDPGRLVTGLTDLLQRTLGETVALESVVGAGLWPVLADPAELENALVNLAVNARDAMPQGGHLTIETSNAELDEEYVAAIADPPVPGQYVLIAVSDTGKGMDQDALRQAFEPFFTTKDVGKGTGLGLSQVYGFVRQSGGHVRIYSELGRGTTVKLYLPRHLGAAPASIEAAAGERLPSLRGSETILVVEDHDDLRAYSTGVLRDLGYRVLAATDAASGLGLLEREPHVTLLFTDMILPGGVDGRLLAREAQRRQPGLKVLFTTGYAPNAVLREGRLDPCMDLIGKPFTGQALASRVRATLDR